MMPAMDAHASPDELLGLWFGPPGGAPLANAKLWFTKDDAFDRSLRERFEGTLEAYVRGELPAWGASPRTRLASVVLLDQLSRNMFRGTPRSFAQDPLALALAEEILASGDYAALAPVERAFILLPLMHAEDRARQRRCVAEYQKLLAGAESEEMRKFFANNVDYGERHAAIVERFGRFPHRNAVLGRTSTEEEVEFLKQPGSSF